MCAWDACVQHREKNTRKHVDLIETTSVSVRSLNPSFMFLWYIQDLPFHFESFVNRQSKQQGVWLRKDGWLSCSNPEVTQLQLLWAFVLVLAAHFSSFFLLLLRAEGDRQLCNADTATISAVWPISVSDRIWMTEPAASPTKNSLWVRLRDSLQIRRLNNNEI